MPPLDSVRPARRHAPFLAIVAAAVLAFAPPAGVQARTASGAPVAVGPQYDTTHVYVATEDVDRFVQSFVATFGGQSTKQVVATVTPTPSSTTSQLVQTPVGTISVFGFRTPIPFPFGLERNGYLVTDLDAAVAQARAAGADVQVAPFPDPIGRDAVVQWPGGVNLQLYWHTAKPAYPAFDTVPENRVYVSPDRVAAFVRSFTAFSHGKVVQDSPRASGEELGLSGSTYHRLRIESTFGRMLVLSTDGHLPWPYGRETTGYEVHDLAQTLARAQAAGAQVVVAPIVSEGRSTAIVQFPGGYLAEIHALAGAAAR
jgi:predicted enzyme related to lactoylglutathione lyase